MALDLSDEILQDFLVEAGEIIEKLGEQLVDLENHPSDSELLNSVFRGFHTVKGGAGFLSIDPLVEICHRTEDLFNDLRSGKLKITAKLMDSVQEAYESITVMFESMNSGQMPDAPDAKLIAALDSHIKGELVAATPEKNAAPIVEAAPELVPAGLTDEAADGDITDSEFEALLDSMAVDKSTSSDSDDISDEEFEKLLDDIHGAPSAIATEQSDSPPIAISAPHVGDEGSESATIIDDSEFEKLLDSLHGSGQAPGKISPSTSEGSQAASSSKEPAKKSATDVMVRVNTQHLDEIMNLVGELVLVRNRLAILQQPLEDKEISKGVATLDLVTSDLQTAVMRTRMQPIKKVFGRFPRVVRNMARSLGKEIDLVLIGEDTGLDKNLVDALADPMVHLVRNAVDHGIELPSDRELASKDRKGTVTLSARQEGDHILLMVEDDGKGMDPDSLKESALKKGLIDTELASRMTDQQAFDLIFYPGFSTKQAITDISGRGVGMDVVKSSLNQLNAVIEIRSEKGVGSTFMIRAPLTLAILPTLMVVVGDQRFAFPLDTVHEILDLEIDHMRVIDNQDMMMVRGKAMPLFFLRRWLMNGIGSSDQVETYGEIVTVKIGSQLIGFVVDQLVGQEEVVIKPLGEFVESLPSFAGATIGGDGKIALIFDVMGMAKNYAHSYAC